MITAQGRACRAVPVVRVGRRQEGNFMGRVVRAGRVAPELLGREDLGLSGPEGRAGQGADRRQALADRGALVLRADPAVVVRLPGRVVPVVLVSVRLPAWAGRADSVRRRLPVARAVVVRLPARRPRISSLSSPVTGLL